jgi:O-antigen/teichoic acid export membrane protein
MIRNIFSNWASFALNLAVAFLLSPFLVHSLGDSGYGLWVLVLSVTGYMGLLDTGLRISIVKHTAESNARGDFETLNRVLFTGLSLYGSLSLIVVLLSLGAAAIFDNLFNVAAADMATGRLLVFIAGVNVALSLPLGVFGGLLAGLQRYDLLNRATILVLLARTAAVVVAVSSGYGVLTLGLIHVISQVLNAGLLLYYAKRQFPQLDLRPRKLEGPTVRNLYAYSGYIVLNNIAMFLLFYSGEVLVGAFIGTAAVTSYAIARSLVQYLSTIIGSMTQVFHPYASDQHERGNANAVAQALIVGTKTSLLIALPIGAAYLLVGPTFIKLWMGPAYEHSAGLILALLTVPQIVWLSQSTAGNVLLGIGKHRLVTTVNLVTGIAGIAIGLVLVSYFGAAGVALGMALPILISQAIVLPIGTARALRMTVFDYFTGAYLGPILAVIPFAATLFVISRLSPATNLLLFALQVVVSLMAFVPAAFFLAFSREERHRLVAKLGLQRFVRQDLVIAPRPSVDENPAH